MIRITQAIALVALLCACRARTPDLGLLYDTVAKAHGVERNPVIVIPGILGSTLKQSGSERIVVGRIRRGLRESEQG